MLANVAGDVAVQLNVSGAGGTGSCSRAFTVAAAPGPALKEIQFTKVASNAPGGASFHSHTQRLSVTGHGIFVAFNDTNLGGNVHRWSLRRSTNGGSTFQTLYSQTHDGSAPDIETDEDGYVYVFVNDAATKALSVHKFGASNGFTSPLNTWQYANAEASKFSAIYDRTRQRFYYLGFNDGPFLTIDRNGTLLSNVQLLQKGSQAHIQYPHFALDGTRLYAAWTTTPPGYITKPYLSIHFIYSDDGGASWRSPAGQSLNVPIVSDPTGPTEQIVPSKYLGSDVPWLSNFSISNGHAAFTYAIQRPPSGTNINQQYQLYRMSPFAQLVHRDGGFAGETLQIWSPGGAFFTKTAAGTLYVVGSDLTRSDGPGAAPIVVLKSTDNGRTWTDYAISSGKYFAFGLSGMRLLPSGSDIVGFFGEWRTSDPAANVNDVYFIKIPAE